MNQDSLKSLLLIGLALMPAACGTKIEPASSEPKFQVGSAEYDDCKEAKKEGFAAYQACRLGITGHEVLTRSAILLANTYIEKMDDSPELYSVYGEKLDFSGYDSKDAIVRGNYATDKPETIKEFHEPIIEWQFKGFGVPRNSNWHEGPMRQKFHSLRDYPGGDTKLEKDLDSNSQTCNKVRNIILETTKIGVRKWQLKTHPLYMKNVDSQKEAEYFIGSLTHTIQDSFSAAHVQREENKLLNVFNPVQFCKFGDNEVPGVCHHTIWTGSVAPHAHDRIWEESLGSPFGPRHLKKEAKLAVQTTALYLTHLYRIGKMGLDMNNEVADFYLGSLKLREELDETEPSGSFNCTL